MELRMIDREADYPVLRTWWEGHGWPAVVKEALPKLGVMCGHMAAGWVYMDNSVPVGMLEWIITDPQAPEIATARAVKTLIGFLRDEAKRQGYPVLLSTCKQASLARLLEKSGFQITDTGMIHLMGVFP